MKSNSSNIGFVAAAADTSCFCSDCCCRCVVQRERGCILIHSLRTSSSSSTWQSSRVNNIANECRRHTHIDEPKETAVKSLASLRLMFVNYSRLCCCFCCSCRSASYLALNNAPSLGYKLINTLSSFDGNANSFLSEPNAVRRLHPAGQVS